MKKAMNQSKMVLILNGSSILALLVMVVFLFAYSSMNTKLTQVSEDRYNLTYNANRFMNASSYLTNEVRAYAATSNKTHYNNYMNEVNNLKNREAGVSI